MGPDPRKANQTLRVFHNRLEEERRKGKKSSEKKRGFDKNHSWIAYGRTNKEVNKMQGNPNKLLSPEGLFGEIQKGECLGG